NSEIVLFVDGPCSGEEAARIQLFVAQELKGAAVEIIGAGLGDETGSAARSVTCFGLEAGGLHGEFREGLDRGTVHGRSGLIAALLVPGDRGAVERHAPGIIAAGNAEGASRGRDFRCRGRQVEGTARLAVYYDRKSVDEGVRDGGSHAGRIGLQQLGSRG